MAAYKNIALYGAGGDNIGKYILEALVKESYNITVIARESSTSTYNPAARVVRVAENLPHGELVSALRGQDVVISAVGFAATFSQIKIIDAAIEAGVKRFFPTEFGLDNADQQVRWLSASPRSKYEIQQYLEAKVEQNPDFTWTGVATGVWLEWSLVKNFLSINAVEHTVSYWDDGTHDFSYSTLPYAAQGVVVCLQHPDETKNKRVFLEASVASQREIVAELEKQQGVTYIVKEGINGIATGEAARHKYETSGDYAALNTTVTALVLAKQYESNFVKSGRGPMVESLASLPQITLADVIEMVKSQI